jgi:hypothetical protein
VEQETIGNWTVADLVRFVQTLTRDDETVSALARGTENFTVAGRLTVSSELQLMQSSATVGVAGAASAPPASPELYAKVVGPDGAVRLIPLYRTP